MTLPPSARLPCTVLSGFLGEAQVELDSSARRSLPNPFPPLEKP
jgi:hypothetical protein